MTTPVPEYREILLTKGQVALVDAADYRWLSQWKWQAQHNPFVKGFYAVRNECRNGVVERIQMHRLILGLRKGDEEIADHVNRKTLDNRRCNLRVADRCMNTVNTSRKPPSSGYRGVYQKKNRYVASIRRNGISQYLGSFKTAEEARDVYQAFARCQYPEGVIYASQN